MRKDKILSIRITDQEFVHLTEEAKTSGKLVSEVVREKLFAPKPQPGTIWNLPLRWEVGFPVSTTGTATTNTATYWFPSGGANT